MTQDHTQFSTLSEISTYTSVDAIIFPKDNESPDRIFENICEEIRVLCNEINKEIRKNQRTENTVVNAEKTIMLPDMSALLENKTNVINKLIAQIKDSEINDFPHYRGEATMSIPIMMEEESNTCRKACEYLNKLNLENETYTDEMLQSEKFLDEILDAPLIENKDDESFEKINREINKEFKQCKRDMKTVIDTLYPNSNFMEVLGDLIETSSNNKDGWYEISDPNHLPTLFFLKECGIVKTNEKNIQQMKLII